METLFTFVLVIGLLAAGLAVLTRSFAGGGRAVQPLSIALRVAQWLLLAALVLMLMPLLLLLLFAIWLLSPKGRVWSTYWGHVLANATTGLWHWVFGPPKMRIHRSRYRRALRRRRRFDNRWN